jgi:hypothetical protein
MAGLLRARVGALQCFGKDVEEDGTKAVLSDAGQAGFFGCSGIQLFKAGHMQICAKDNRRRRIAKPWVRSDVVH